MKKIIFLFLLFCFCSEKPQNTTNTMTDYKSWKEVLQKAKGQTIYFSAWGGLDSINQYIVWASEQVKETYGINVKHIKEKDPAGAINRILAEKAAGKTKDSSIDVVWLNGENFKSLKQNEMLFEFVQFLPNEKLLDWDKKNLGKDFTIPVDNLEAPWGTAKLTFIYDSSRLNHPPNNAKELLAFAEKNQGRFLYPKPPSFYGITFLKQVLLELSEEREVFSRPVEKDKFDELSKPLWEYLDKLHPFLWKQGKVFPNDIAQTRQTLEDAEVDLIFTFNPYESLNYVKRGELPKTVRSYFFENGTIGNTHYLAIPKNSSSKEAALVFIDFLLSPKAQARKSNPDFWGDPTVLDLDKLSSSDKLSFEKIDYGDSAPQKWTKNLPEPHPSWVDFLQREWQNRYAK